MPDYPALDRLQRALNPLPNAAVDGPHQLSVTGTMNIIGGGSGGTSMTDNQPFTPGSTSVTPMAGYFGGRSVSSGNAAAVSIDHSGNLQVNVVAGGAGGGIANLSVRGTANADIHVGFASGANLQQDGGAALPITGTVAVGGMVGSVNAVLGTLPVPVVGSMGVTPLASFTVNLGGIATVNLGLGTVNIGNNPTVLVGSIPAGSLNVLAGQAGAPWSMTTASFMYADSTNSAIRVNVIAGGAGGGVANLTVRGSANTDLHVGYASGAGANVDGGAYMPVLFATGVFPTVWLGGIGTDTVNSAIRVNVVAGGAGGGVANLEVQGTANTAIHVGFASGAGIYADGGAVLPVVGTVNVANGGGFATVGVYGSVGAYGTMAVYGSPAFPVYNVGSVNVVNTVTVNLATVLDKANDSITVYQGQAASLNAQVDTAAGFTATFFPIALNASGYNTLQVGPSGAALPKLALYGLTLITDATVGFNIQSPSGTYLTGSLAQLLPGAGFVAQSIIRNPVMISASGNAATMFLYLNTAAHVSGWAQGYVASLF